VEAADIQRAVASRRSAARSKPGRAARGAAREAILAALEHGSHTVGELAVVTAMSGPNINGNMRRLLDDGVVVKTEREGKIAWALSDTVI
jgi:DNA-binding transcriptional ArsR family regulator